MLYQMFSRDPSNSCTVLVLHILHRSPLLIDPPPTDLPPTCSLLCHRATQLRCVRTKIWAIVVCPCPYSFTTRSVRRLRDSFAIENNVIFPTNTRVRDKKSFNELQSYFRWRSAASRGARTTLERLIYFFRRSRLISFPHPPCNKNNRGRGRTEGAQRFPTPAPTTTHTHQAHRIF